MKHFILSLLLLFAVTSSLSAQATVDIKVKYDVSGREVQHASDPAYYPEDGVVKVKVCVDKYGFVDEAILDSTVTTVKNRQQLKDVLSVAKGTRFSSNYDAVDSLYGAISYSFRHLNAVQLDSLRTEYIADIVTAVGNVSDNVTKPYYKLYPTDNMWTFIELDTISGMLWQVQYTVEKDAAKYRFKTVLDLQDKRKDTRYPDLVLPGRFELYKTQNMYNFILLDTVSGGTWQVQWSTDWEKRGVAPIE